MEPSGTLDVVTGAFSYSGAAIAKVLQQRGRMVRTLTNHPARAPAGTAIQVRPLAFTEPASLTRALRGADTLYNTYWVRFAHDGTDHDLAVANSRALFLAAADAGVRRVVHISITHPDVRSPLPYFRGKAVVEQALAESGLSHAIIRPAILFGGDGVLINNIAWLLRRVPIFAIGGPGDYRIRGIHVDDLAALCADLGQGERDHSGQDPIVDAVGPDRPTFTQLVAHIRRATGSHSLLVHVPAPVLPVMSAAVGAVLRDKLLTRDEFRAMAAGLADTDGPATGATSILDWIDRNAANLGRRYANEIHRHFTPAS